MRGTRHTQSMIGWQTCRIPFVAVLSSGLFALSACSGGGSSDSTSPSVSKIVVQPMTNVMPSTHGGYFSDPYPIQQTKASASSTFPAFSGTTRQTLTCPGNLQPGCFAATANALDLSRVAPQAAAHGASITGFENLNIFQDSMGAWHMAVTVEINNPSAPQGKTDWHVIMHAHPTSTAAGIPTAWTADSVLAGSLSGWAAGNYDGKYVEDAGTLYLVYSMNLADTYNGIAAQAMQSATTPASSAPVPLLGPETGNGAYNSELFYGLGQSNQYRQIETGNVTKIQGKYVMTYSVGGYNQPDYKAGIAWSDTFLPTSGGTYQRVQKMDTAGVWGQPNHAEVQYLLQSQEAQWPNYVADQVLSPGVPSIVSDTSGRYFLVFAGYAPSDAPTQSGLYIGSYRRPFYVGLDVNIPAGAVVGKTSPQDLASWIQPATTPSNP
ncbi:hypothetical protein [Caballeronia sp. LZ035]|uniref:hypothetical protein n=1 Tax=Caballeronia sp. LZ035 TaxID=3038568 RepID=UPI002865B474|nr:hypothetical protein [Caballeronia sp. LZ035]MDR5759076.1 hypothetical protein [Caballeronia sp. LZ035]